LKEIPRKSRPYKAKEGSITTSSKIGPEAALCKNNMKNIDLEFIGYKETLYPQMLPSIELE